jgi:spore germination protein GerM
MSKPILIGVILFLIVLGAVVYFVRDKPVEQNEPGQNVSTPAPSAKIPERKINVKLFFYDQSSRELAAESRSVTYRTDIHAQVREVLSALIEGPAEKLIPTIPEGTRVLDIFVQPNGVAYVDFSGELATNHVGGTDAEIVTVYSIIDTLTYNFPQIKQVQILLDDRAVDTLKGHLDLSRPLAPDLSVANLPS